MLDCLGARSVKSPGGEALLQAGEPAGFIGVLLSGTAHIRKDGLDGQPALIARLGPGDLFAETLCLAGRPSPVWVMTQEPCQVLRLPAETLLHPLQEACRFHARLLENLLRIMAEKNLHLQARMEILAAKTLREKVLLYLRPFLEAQGQRFVLPLTREQMAAYLGVDRSALSHELMRMKTDGWLTYRKNHFTLLRSPREFF